MIPRLGDLISEALNDKEIGRWKVFSSEVKGNTILVELVDTKTPMTENYTIIIKEG